MKRSKLVLVVAGLVVVVAVAVILQLRADMRRASERAARRDKEAKQMARSAPVSKTWDTAMPPSDPEPYDPSDRELAEKLLRGRVHLQRLSEEMRKSGVDDSFEAGDDPRDVWWVNGICTQALLDDLASRMRASFSSFGFRRMRCSTLSAPL